MFSQVDPGAALPLPTGIGELDRVLAGGLVPGSVTVLGGEPGVGKSTLVLQMLAAAATRGAVTLLIAAEESSEQVRRRSERLAATVDNCYVLATSELDAVVAGIRQVEPSIVVVDSIQAVTEPELAAQAGSPSQVRACAQRLVRVAKSSRVATLLVGHVTKDGSLAGPRTLEHLVDTVLSFEGDRHHRLRMLSASKHRYGPTGELGLFEMGESGLVGVADPSSLLLGDRRQGAPGSIAVPVLEGHRALVVELQGLVARSPIGAPRRVAQGVASGRLTMLLAVLGTRCDLDLSSWDVFASAVGGIKVVEPAADLGLALALLSAWSQVAIADDVVALGEVGLSGELRQVVGLERRLKEAHRLGFRRAVVPSSCPDGPADLQLLRAGTISEAARLLLEVGPAIGPESSEASRTIRSSETQGTGRLDRKPPSLIS